MSASRDKRSQDRKPSSNEARKHKQQEESHPIKDRLIEEGQGKRAGTRSLPDRDNNRLH